MDYKFVIPVALCINAYEWVKGLFGCYTWKPKERMVNTASKRIENFPKNLKLKNGDLCVENGDLALVSKEEGFAQQLQCFISTYVGECFFNRDYGCEFVDSIFKANQKEFKRQCEHLAMAIIKHDTFKDYIEEIYEIRRKKEKILFGKTILITEVKLKGRPDTFIVKLYNVGELRKERLLRETTNETKI